ncbi:twin-arginine translocase subunit TatC [Glutamicibacter sp. M10]|nr:twin-arginine translocase subunit TatC [Glutamicibacter sp. M10]UXN31107.1 twin-arginine translocase subunit TatC [Glutamicibacter sp. M10]
MAIDKDKTPRTKKKRVKDEEGRMSLKEHLIEARNRLFISLIALTLGTVAGFFLYDWLLELIIAPVEAAGGSVNFTAVMSPFDIMIKVALFVGILISSPVWLYQLWAFIVPGLKRTSDASVTASSQSRFRYLSAALRWLILCCHSPCTSSSAWLRRTRLT